MSVRQSISLEHKAWKKEYAKSEKAEREALRKAMQKAEARRASRVKTAHDVIERRFSEGDSLYDELKTMERDKRTTDAERIEFLKAIDKACNRLEMIKRWIGPKPSVVR